MGSLVIGIVNRSGRPLHWYRPSPGLNIRLEWRDKVFDGISDLANPITPSSYMESVTDKGRTESISLERFFDDERLADGFYRLKIVLDDSFVNSRAQSGHWGVKSDLRSHVFEFPLTILHGVGYGGIIREINADR